MAPRKKVEAAAVPPEAEGAVEAAAESTESADKPKASKPAKGSFVVYDSNGNKFRAVEDAEEATALAKEIGGLVRAANA